MKHAQHMEIEISICILRIGLGGYGMKVVSWSYLLMMMISIKLIFVRLSFLKAGLILVIGWVKYSVIGDLAMIRGIVCKGFAMAISLVVQKVHGNRMVKLDRGGGSLSMRMDC